MKEAAFHVDGLALDEFSIDHAFSGWNEVSGSRYKQR
jgi:hypothetical protein